MLDPVLSASENNDEVRRWLDNYKKERLEKTPGKTQKTTTTTSSPTCRPRQSSPPILATLESRQQQHCTPTKKPRSKRGLASELEQENVPLLQQQQLQQQQQQQQSQQAPYPHHISPRRLAGEATRPLEAQRLMLNPATASSSPLQSAAYFPVIRSPVRSPMRRCILPRSPIRNLPNRSPLRRSPMRRSILQERLARSSPVARRVALDDSVSSAAPTSSPLSSPARPPPQSPVKFPKKRWLREAFSQQQEQRRDKRRHESESDDLARPIRWGDEPSTTSCSRANPPSPKSLIVATALVELKGSREAVTATSAMAEEYEDDSQPLNLSLSSPSLKSK